jgi:hypothetical protein
MPTKTWNNAGQIIDTNDEPIYNDLTELDVLEDAPDVYFFPVVIPASNDMRRLALVSSTYLRQPRLQLTAAVADLASTNEELANQAEMLESAVALLNAQAADAQTIHSQLQAHQNWIDEAIVDLQESDAELSAMSESLEASVAQLQEHDSQIDTQQAQISGLIHDLQTTDAELAQQSQRLDASQVAQDVLLAQLQAAQNTLATFQTQQAAIIADMHATDVELAAHDQTQALQITAIQNLNTQQDATLQAIQTLDSQQASAITAINALDSTQSGLITALQNAVNAIQAVDTAQSALITALQTRKQPVPVGDATIPASALITITLGIKRFTNVAITGLLVGDIAYIMPKAMTIGYRITGWDKNVTTAGILNYIDMECPILAGGGTPQVMSTLVVR